MENNMKKYEENMNEYLKIMMKYEGNMKELKKCGEYEGISGKYQGKRRSTKISFIIIFFIFLHIPDHTLTAESL